MAARPAMTILALRTDKPEAELYIYSDRTKLAELKWRADRQLADSLNQRIEEILNMLSISYDDLEGIICFAGPGSFTGLRIGLSVANAIAFAQEIPIVSIKGENWLTHGISELQVGKNDKIGLPYYDRPANTTKPKK